MKIKIKGKEILLISFSKLLALFACVLIGLTWYKAMILSDQDTTIMYYLLPFVSGLAMGVFGFYFNKAKAENLIKINSSYPSQQDCSNDETIKIIETSQNGEIKEVH